MAKKLKVYHAKLKNMGDLLNILIIEKCFGYKVVHRTYLSGELSGIGSGLGNFTLNSEKAWIKALQKITGPLFPEVYIWGTGFINYKKEDTAFYRKNMHFCAVRGELSKKRVEKILGKKLDIPLADAGILASELIDTPLKKKYNVGVIAHFKEDNHPIFKEIAAKFKNSIIINLADDPLEVVKQIAQCEVIISSSLHGLIVADSFNIPNHHIVVTDNLLGDGFKFDDYYSAYGVAHEYTDMNKDKLPTLEWIVDNYHISETVVTEKKKQMLACFPYEKI